jgi:hypothetical protein
MTLIRKKTDKKLGHPSICPTPRGKNDCNKRLNHDPTAP